MRTWACVYVRVSPTILYLVPLLTHKLHPWQSQESRQGYTGARVSGELRIGLRLLFLGQQWRAFKFHPHADVSNCDVDMTDYRDTFREHITFGAGVCWRCGAAKALGHTGNGFGSFCENKDLQEFIRPLAYIVLNSPGLRQQVFAEIQINPTYFFTHQLDYAQWLGLKSRGIEKWAHHLFEVLYRHLSPSGTPK